MYPSISRRSFELSYSPQWRSSKRDVRNCHWIGLALKWLWHYFSECCMSLLPSFLHVCNNPNTPQHFIMPTIISLKVPRRSRSGKVEAFAPNDFPRWVQSACLDNKPNTRRIAAKNPVQRKLRMKNKNHQNSDTSNASHFRVFKKCAAEVSMIWVLIGRKYEYNDDFIWLLDLIAPDAYQYLTYYHRSPRCLATHRFIPCLTPYGHDLWQRPNPTAWACTEHSI